MRLCNLKIVENIRLSLLPYNPKKKTLKNVSVQQVRLVRVGWPDVSVSSKVPDIRGNLSFSVSIHIKTHLVLILIVINSNCLWLSIIKNPLLQVNNTYIVGYTRLLGISWTIGLNIFIVSCWIPLASPPSPLQLLKTFSEKIWDVKYNRNFLTYSFF